MFPFTPFKIFVKESDKVETGRKHFPVTPLTGDKAKEFYEDVLREPSSPKIIKCTKPKVKAKPVRRKTTFKDSDLLRMAQDNDVKNLKIFISENPNRDLNVVDEFGWTPLMCASCSGAEEAVEVLLESGADPGMRDRLGNTASELARQKNHLNIVKMLENGKTKPDVTEEPELESVEPFFCPVCKENFAMNKSKHESSTLHLFNSRLKSTTFYGIPECNRGFQLLLREGWDKEKGLGPDGSGRKFPVKAIMKKDRLGIGAPPPPSAKDKGEAQTKRRKLYNRWREKDFEKNFRLEFS